MAAVIPDLKTQWLKDGFAVEILDLDLPTASEEELLAFDDLCRRYAVVVVRDQNLSPKQVMDVSSRLGRVSPQNYTGPHPDFPGISILSNKMVDGKLIGVRDAGRNWHTDGTTYQKLGLRTMLYGVECPPEGSDTLVADAAAAFDALPEERQAELEKLSIVHNRAHLIQKYSRSVLSPEEMARMQDVIHPIVVKSDVDGRKSLFITNGSTKRIEGMEEEESWALVNELVEHCTQPQFVYAHKWRAGDCLIWNDVGTLHRATPYDEEKYIRLVYRTWMRPFAAAAMTSDVEAALQHH
ncbi:MAG TPA: TauD/TfdA family dioxygenase [Beijerinckiaceae bacterium]|jgi:taurine dioxygenase|nr:TauD/TfdA family dioxygenase [Beijerinckiaceae bacterium]